MKTMKPFFVFCLLFFNLSPFGLPLDPQKPITQYVHDSWGLEDGLPQLSVRTIVQTRDGYLWLGTDEGFVRFDGVHFEVYNKRKVEQLLSNIIMELIEDRRGNLWIGTYGGGLTRMKDGKFTTYTTRDGLAHNIVWSLCEDSGGNLWVGTADGLNRLTGTGRFETYT
ncbi:MAG: hybrid sensor histidine kinase/response regulator, partial [bacterium]|nr:hybrid sensor histidine kinase/response regulator [bacterium]